jgi:hypothetical protein
MIAIKGMRPLLFMVFGTTALLTTQTKPSDTIFVHVQVTDSKKMPAAGLKAENFQIWEDGIEQKISYFSESGGPWDVNLILLGAGNRYGRVAVDEKIAEGIEAAALEFKKLGNPGNKYSFDVLPDTGTGDGEFWPAMVRNLAELKKSTNPRRALIVVTTGFDASSGGQRIDSQTEDPNVPVYLVFLKFPSVASGSDLTLNSGAYATKGSVLMDLAIKTRGDYFLISPDKIKSQLVQLAMDMKNDYVIGFKSANRSKDNAWRKLKVKVTSPVGQNLGAMLKDRYYAQKP